MLAPAVYSPLPLRPQNKSYVWNGSLTATEAKEKKDSSVLLLRGQTLVGGEMPEAYEIAFQQPNLTGVSEAVVLNFGLKPGFGVVAVADVSGFNLQTNFMQKGVPQITNLLHISSPFTTTAMNESSPVVASAFAVQPVTGDWFGQMTARILRFPKLRAGWDSYGGQTISHLAAARALGVASRLAMTMALGAASPTKAFASPTHSGGVLFEVRNGNRELLLEIIPGKAEYEVSQITSLDSGDEELNEVNISESHLPEVLNWIAGKS